MIFILAFFECLTHFHLILASSNSDFLIRMHEGKILFLLLFLTRMHVSQYSACLVTCLVKCLVLVVLVPCVVVRVYSFVCV